jgi:hypothetical protein
MLTRRKATLPALDSIAAYQKISAPNRRMGKPNVLDLVAGNTKEIQDIVNSLF